MVCLGFGEGVKGKPDFEIRSGSFAGVSFSLRTEAYE